MRRTVTMAVLLVLSASACSWFGDDDGSRGRPAAIGSSKDDATDDAGRGGMLDDLVKVRGTAGAGEAFSGCAGFVTKETGLCTHGPDLAPPGHDVVDWTTPVASRERSSGSLSVGQGAVSTAVPGSGAVLCWTDGSEGRRVQGLYVTTKDAPDRHGQLGDTFQALAEATDHMFNASATLTGGIRHIKFQTDANCRVAVDRVILDRSGGVSFDATIADLKRLGYDRRDRTYLIWFDRPSGVAGYCGIASFWADARPTGDNRNHFGPAFARVDTPCWGWAEGHEVVHTFGGVQASAPNSTGSGGHCTDEWDAMCYDDGSGKPLRTVCGDRSLDRLFDCNGDDYYSANPPPGSYLSQNWNPANSDWLIRSWLWPGRFHPLPPRRILDTRDGTGGHGRLQGGRQIDVAVAGNGGIPSGPVSAIAVNVTMVNPSSAGYLSVFPAAGGRPVASNLNFVAGETVANLVIVKVGENGHVSLFLDTGSADVLFDTAGWFSADTDGNFGRYQAVAPSRLLDTRDGTGGRRAALGPGESMNLLVGGRGGIPSRGLAAFALNVTVTNPTAGGHLRIYPAFTPLPNASNINFSPGQTVANRAIVTTGDNGWITIYNDAGTTDVIVDVNGWFTTESVPGPPGYLVPGTPARVLDTRIDRGEAFAGRSKHTGALRGGSAVDVQVGGRGGVPSGASAVVMNVTVVSPTSGGFLTLWPAGASRPLASDVNFTAGEVVPNLVIVKIGQAGRVGAFVDSGRAHLLFDVVGYLQ